MPAELIRMDVENLDRWRVTADQVLARLQDLSPVFEWADLPFRAEMHEQFATEGAYLEGGVKWTALSPEYARRKPSPPSPFGILYRSGDLYRSLAEGGGDHVKIIEPLQAWYGTSDTKGMYHQRGTEKMPQRRIIRVRDRFRQLIKTAVAKYLLTGEAPEAHG